jgi:hypothetical protein
MVPIKKGVNRIAQGHRAGGPADPPETPPGNAFAAAVSLPTRDVEIDVPPDRIDPDTLDNRSGSFSRSDGGDQVSLRAPARASAGAGFKIWDGSSAHSAEDINGVRP